MRCSVNEFEAALIKAARGAGLPMGIAEDLASAGCWLCLNGYDGANAVLESLANISNSDQPELGETARCGPAIIDSVIADPETVFVVENASAPLLLAGLAGIAARDYSIAFQFDTNRGAVTIRGDSISDVELLPTDHGTLKITVSEFSREDEFRDDPGNGFIIDDKLWKSISALAHKTYVPATEASRESGAGAGLTDND